MSGLTSVPGSRPKNVGSIGVSTGPGQITLQRIVGARANATDLAKVTSAPLVSA